MAVTISELEGALEFVSTDGGGMATAVFDRKTGEIYMQSDLTGIRDKEFPDGVDEERYVEIPNRNDLNLGKRLVMSFASKCLADDYREILDIFNRRGAYRRFKDYLIHRGALEQWYEYSRKAEQQVLREWCADNKIELSD